MFNAVQFEGIVAIIFSLSIPIVAILMVFISSIKNKRQDTELRLALIQAGTDAETAKSLIAEQAKKHDKYSSLRNGCFFAGAGLGAAAAAISGINDAKDIFFWLIIAAGIGVGQLIAFAIEYKLTQKERRERNFSASDAV